MATITGANGQQTTVAVTATQQGLAVLTQSFGTNKVETATVPPPPPAVATSTPISTGTGQTFTSVAGTSVNLSSGTAGTTKLATVDFTSSTAYNNIALSGSGAVQVKNSDTGSAGLVAATRVGETVTIATSGGTTVLNVNGDGNTSVVGGTGNLVGTVGGTNVTVVLGTGNLNSLNVDADNAKLDLSAGGSAVIGLTSGSNNTSITGGSGTMTAVAGSGTNLNFTAGSGAANFVAAQGATDVTLKVTAGSGTSGSVVINAESAVGGSLELDFSGQLSPTSSGSGELLGGASGDVLLASPTVAVAAGGLNVKASNIGGTVWGGTGTVSITGGDVALTVAGGSNGNTLRGGSASNLLGGGAKGDSITGGTGSSTIIGGLGNDTLTGGAGKDVFIYRPGDGNDSLVGFDPTKDQLAFTSTVFGTKTLDLASLLSTATVSGGNTVLTLPDGSTITVVGSTSVSMSWFTAK